MTFRHLANMVSGYCLWGSARGGLGLQRFRHPTVCALLGEESSAGNPWKKLFNSAWPRFSSRIAPSSVRGAD